MTAMHEVVHADAQREQDEEDVAGEDVDAVLVGKQQSRDSENGSARA
nr:hypothetical protein [Filomicrobium sp.]